MTVRYHTRRGVEVPDYQCMTRCIQDGAAALPDHPRRRRRRRHRPAAARHPHPARPRGRPHRAGRTRHPRRRSRRAAPQPRRTRPPPRRPGPPPLPGRRPRQPAGRRQPGSRLERRAARPASRAGGLRTRQRRRHSHAHRRAQGTESVPWPPISPPCGPTRTPRSASANAWSGCSSTTSPCTKTDRIHLHVRFRGGQTTSLDRRRSRRQPGSSAKPTPTPSPRSTGSSTTTPTPRPPSALNAAGHRSGEGKPFTARIVLDLRRSHHLPSHADRLRAQGLLTITETRRTPRRAPHHHQGLAPRRNAHLPQGQRQEHRLFEPPTPATPGSSHDKAARSENEFPPNPRQEVHYGAPVLLDVD